MLYSSIVNSFEDITGNLVGQMNFTNITVSRDALAFMGERVSLAWTLCGTPNTKNGRPVIYVGIWI